MHTETKAVTYLNGHRIEVGGKVYRHERTCHDFGGEEGTNGEGCDFACSTCGYCCDVCEPRFCPNCGARVEG